MHEHHPRCAGRLAGPERRAAACTPAARPQTHDHELTCRARRNACGSYVVHHIYYSTQPPRLVAERTAHPAHAVSHASARRRRANQSSGGAPRVAMQKHTSRHLPTPNPWAGPTAALRLFIVENDQKGSRLWQGGGFKRPRPLPHSSDSPPFRTPHLSDPQSSGCYFDPLLLVVTTPKEGGGLQPAVAVHTQRGSGAC